MKRSITGIIAALSVRHRFTIFLKIISVNVALIIAGCSTAHLPNEDINADDLKNVTWLSSTSPEVTLGVTDKNGGVDLREHKPVFIVTDPAGKKYAASNSYSGPAYHAEVIFPSSYDINWPMAGRYSWKCFVQSNCVAQGQFECHESPFTVSVIYEEK